MGGIFTNHHSRFLHNISFRKWYHISYSFLFFATSGALLFVTLWGFWDDEFSRRGFKQYQNSYFKAQYARAEVKWKAADQAVVAKEQAIKDSLVLVDRELAGSDDYQILVDQVEEAEIKLAEVKEKKKSPRKKRKA